MVKFSRELEAQLIPEWKDAFVNYRQLKKHVKKVKLAPILRPSDVANTTSHPHGTQYLGFSLLDPLRYIAARLSGSTSRSVDTPIQEDKENMHTIELINSKEDAVRDFFEKLEEELEKVNSFYTTKEAEFCERGEILTKQLQILLDLKQILHEYHRQQRRHHKSTTRGRLSSTPSSSPDGLNTPSSFSGEAEDSPSPLAEELMAALERNGVSFEGSARGKTKKGMKPKAAAMRIHIPPTTPGRTISAVTSMIWEDLVNGSRRDNGGGGGGGGGDYISRKKIQCAEKMIRGAFVELYKGLGLIRTYSSLNMVAFTKILKKFDKVSKQQTSANYLKKVKRSHFISSDKVVKLCDDVETIFTKHFAGNDRKKAMKFLKPQQPKDSHMITFFVGLFTGSFTTLFSVYAILAHLSGIFSSSTEAGYMETVYPVFSMFALLSLHIFLYGCNLLMWKSTRINHNFIFEFSPGTALKHRDAFLICTCFMTMVVGGMVVHLILLSTEFSIHHVDNIPGILLILSTAILICPFNIFYRSTRYCFLRVMRNIIFSPFYRVLMVDFFMADQLTSQIPLLRHMEFTACYFMAGIFFKANPYETCTRSQQYKQVAYFISFFPYYSRALQCFRRYVEEGYDANHLANAGKYVSAMVAAAARMKYAVDPTGTWLVIVVITSFAATCYQLYWDFVKDWGMFDPRSKNIWLRDDLVLKNKSIYYASIGFNLVLRLAWVETVLQLRLGDINHRLVDFLLASLEIVRRGHWNFYRLENEHLNNVGKFRAVKTVPLPFREMDSDD